MSFSKLKHHWYTELYEKEETQTDDVKLILELIGNKKTDNIFEICCGSGRILIPIAKAGHRITGLDRDHIMIAKLFEKAEGLKNVAVQQSDAIEADWGEGYDVLIMGGNILLNIQSDMDNKEAQQLFIQKAYKALRRGGRLYMDNSGFIYPEKFFNHRDERVIFEGIDSSGTSGKMTMVDSTYDEDTQMTSGMTRFELTAKNGQFYSEEKRFTKHVPSIRQMRNWLLDTGFFIDACYGDYQKNPISERTHRAIFWAIKP